MEECVILFLHHKKDDVTNRHFSMMVEKNTKFKVVPLTPESSPRSYLWSYENMWMHNDTMIYDWMDGPDFIKSKRYCWFDWDTRCEQSVDEYFEEVWDSDISGTDLLTTESHPNWQWFSHAAKNQELVKIWDQLRGIAPFCGSIISIDALTESVEKMKKEIFIWKDQIHELRLATCANVIGFELKECGRNSINAFESNSTNGYIFHPVKK